MGHHVHTSERTLSYTRTHLFLSAKYHVINEPRRAHEGRHCR